MEIHEVLRHLRAGESDRKIHEVLGLNRRTIRSYREWAQQQGLLEGALPTPEALHHLLHETLPTPLPPQNISTVEAYRPLVERLRAEGCEIQAIFQRLQEQGYGGSYSSVYRFVRRLEPSTPDVTVRVERAPGEEAQVDFGAAGQLLDPATGRARKAWAFVMTLAWSRHQYVEFVWDQSLSSWLLAHRHAFEFFGGVPKRLVIDNLKSAITRACWENPQVQVAYRECAEHYGFLIAPCRVRTPQHKGKVEKGGVHYLKRNFLAGRRPVLLPQANQEVRAWCLTVAGQRLHGTTREQPLVRFDQTEQARLAPLPPAPYDLALWKEVKVSRDCYVTFDNAYYSVPFRYVGQPLRVRGGTQQVRIFSTDHQLLATHERATQAGQRQTHLDHLPPEKVPGLLLEREALLRSATDIGPATGQIVQTLLADPVLDRLPVAGRLLRLREAYGDARLEAACRRAAHFGESSYGAIKRILQAELDRQPLPVVAPDVPARTFIRSASDLLGHLFGGQLWS